MSEGPHLSVLLGEVVEAIKPASGETIIDGTFGAGGYSRAFLDGGASVVGFDRDPSARRFAGPLEATGRFKLIEARFSEMGDHFAPGSVDGVALDIGVSSMQLDEAERGFSFMRDGPLDMRMGGDVPSAADIVNTADQAELARIFYVYGEERESRRIASFLVRRRAERPFERTLDLAEVVERALGGRRGAKVHPATKVFQALRIAVNEELSELEQALVAAETILKSGGRLAVVTFHSLEDRIVKAFFAERAGRLEGRRMIGRWFFELFTPRTRGFRTVNVLLASAMLTLAVGVNLAKTFAGKERTQIGRVERDIDKEKIRIRILEAEVAHLEQPERLERLSRAYLAMEPVQAKQEATADTVIAVAQQGANGGARATPAGGVR